MARPHYLTDEELQDILNESDDDELFDPDENCSSVDDPEFSDIDSASDLEFDNVEAIEVNLENGIQDPFFVSKDGNVWKTEPVQGRSGNVLNLRPGTRRIARALVMI